MSAPGLLCCPERRRSREDWSWPVASERAFSARRREAAQRAGQPRRRRRGKAPGGRVAGTGTIRELGPARRQVAGGPGVERLKEIRIGGRTSERRRPGRGGIEAAGEA